MDTLTAYWPYLSQNALVQGNTKQVLRINQVWTDAVYITILLEENPEKASAPYAPDPESDPRFLEYVNMIKAECGGLTYRQALNKHLAELATAVKILSLSASS